MNPLSSELPFHVHNWLIISLKGFCIVIRNWPTFWPSSIQIDNKLDWNKHTTVAASGQSKLAFLNRNLKGCQKKTERHSLYRQSLLSLHMTKSL